MNCKGCGTPVTSDGHGELIHMNEEETPGKYGCDPRAPKGGSYPVAR